MYSALHECGHVSVWRQESTAPKEGELITCARCARAVHVTALIGPWRVKCHDCVRVNSHATFRATVMRQAITHAQTWTTHRVHVWQYGDPESVVLISSKNVGTQPELISDAPF